MPDMFTKQKRSEIMSKIRSKGTKIELKMKMALEGSGIEFQYQPKMPGNPDFLILPKTVVFCDSSFWHGRNWSKLKRQLESAHSKEYWVEHINRNRKRDRLISRTLKKQGYTVLRFWEEEIEKKTDECVRRVIEAQKAAKKKNASN